MDKLKQYIKETTPKTEGWLCSLEQYASEHRVPIMEKESMNFLTQLIRIHQPASILEIGTAIGYSALRMHEVQPMATITTIEKSDAMYQLAVENIKTKQKVNKIEIIHGDALQSIEKLISRGDTYDFIFIDAAKGQYKKFFTLVEPLIQSGGIIVCDNILFKGYVANPAKSDNVRLQKLANKIRSFNEWVMEQPNYHSSIIPIGDGISISVKIK